MAQLYSETGPAINEELVVSAEAVVSAVAAVQDQQSVQSLWLLQS